MIAVWRHHYNSIRPHSSLGYQPPAPEVLHWPAINCQPASQSTERLAYKEIRN
jgi:putative transposase